MSEITTAAFLTRGTSKQFSTLLTLYPEALAIKAAQKSNKKAEDELIKLDTWYQNQLPKLIAARSPALFINHEELVQLIKWKLARGKFRPRLKELVTMNSPRVVAAESKKAFRTLIKKGDLGIAVGYLCNLKGIGPSTASAILTAGAPHLAAFMADECLAAVPEIEGIDYTVQEYLDLMRVLNQASTRLSTPTDTWSVHKIEQALWVHNTLLLLKPELLLGVVEESKEAKPDTNGDVAEEAQPGNEAEVEAAAEEEQEVIAAVTQNGNGHALDTEPESSNDGNGISPSADEDSNSQNPIPIPNPDLKDREAEEVGEEEEEEDAPPSKKVKLTICENGDVDDELPIVNPPHELPSAEDGGVVSVAN